MNGFSKGLLVWQLFNVILGVGIAFLVYYIIKKLLKNNPGK